MARSLTLIGRPVQSSKLWHYGAKSTIGSRLTPEKSLAYKLWF
ncbi:MAG: hypothetical protein QW191_05815 [Conexivisphaerales archaeon]